MDTARIAELLQPFLAAPLDPAALRDISTYIDLLQRWNAKINLTAIRQPEEIVTRHFGESLFAARHLLAGPDTAGQHIVDIGSGAGFPGIPLKLWAPYLRVTLIESNQRKVAFLRETIRSLTLTDIDVFPGRAEDYPARASLVTLRAVEHFDEILPTAAGLVAPAGRLALLIGRAQSSPAAARLPHLTWQEPIPIPLAANRILIVGTNHPS